MSCFIIESLLIILLPMVYTIGLFIYVFIQYFIFLLAMPTFHDTVLHGTVVIFIQQKYVKNMCIDIIRLIVHCTDEKSSSVQKHYHHHDDVERSLFHTTNFVVFLFDTVKKVIMIHNFMVIIYEQDTLPCRGDISLLWS